MIRPDHWTSSYNLGNYYLNAGLPKEAVAAYGAAAKLDPRTPVPLVNLSMAYARLGDSLKAEQSLRKALKLDPQSAAAHFNLGLLYAEQKKMRQAENELRLALKYDPQMAGAAYNLGIILAKDRPAESLRMLRKAYEVSPNAKVAYTLAYYERKAGNRPEAVRILREAIEAKPAMADPYLLLGDIYESGGMRAEAAGVYREAAGNEKCYGDCAGPSPRTLRRPVDRSPRVRSRHPLRFLFSFVRFLPGARRWPAHSEKFYPFPLHCP